MGISSGKWGSVLGFIPLAVFHIFLNGTIGMISLWLKRDGGLKFCQIIYTIKIVICLIMLIAHVLSGYAYDQHREKIESITLEYFESVNMNLEDYFESAERVHEFITCIVALVIASVAVNVTKSLREVLASGGTGYQLHNAQYYKSSAAIKDIQSLNTVNRDQMEYGTYRTNEGYPEESNPNFTHIENNNGTFII